MPSTGWRERPDLVLADTNMPCVDGYDLTRWVRDQPHLRTVPVLLLAGATDPVDEQRLHDSGRMASPEKPFEPSHVISRVKELLGMKGRSRRRRRARVTAPAPAPTVEPEPPAKAPTPAAVAAAPTPPVPTPCRPPRRHRSRRSPSWTISAPVAAIDDLFDAFDATFGAERPGPPPGEARPARAARAGRGVASRGTRPASASPPENAEAAPAGKVPMCRDNGLAPPADMFETLLAAVQGDPAARQP
ncbi:MAG: response regulator [Vicinamibacterales bacterium]